MRPRYLLVFVLVFVGCSLVPALSSTAVPPTVPGRPTGTSKPAGTSQPAVKTWASPTSLFPTPTTVPFTWRLPISPGEYNNLMFFGGAARNYILHVPPAYNGSRPVPLVVILHPYSGTNSDIERTSGMDLKADQQDFIVVYPLGTGTPHAWNALFFPARPSEPDDAGFITALIDKLEFDLRIDTRRVYVGGFSNGAMMTYVMGAELSERLAAIAVVSGTVGIKEKNGSTQTIPNPAGPVSLIAIHGKLDKVVPYAGGVAFLGFDFLPVQDSIKLWVKSDGCSIPPRTTKGQQGNILETDYTSCQAGSEVVLVTIMDGGHDWPTTAYANQISATDMIWDFFARHPKP